MDNTIYLLKYMTWPEIQQKQNDGFDTIIINLASVEQHGYHLPECTDEIIGIGLSCGLAEKLGNTLVAPSIIPGLSDHHLPLPGSLSLRQEVFRGVLEDYVSCYRNHGFRKFIMFSSHGGNMETTCKLVSDFRTQYPDTKFCSALTLNHFMKLLKISDEEFHLPAGSSGGHACAFETSLMLYLSPELVKMDKARSGYIGILSRKVTDRLFAQGVKSISETGVLGDPTCATREIGEKLYNSFLEHMEKQVKDQLSG